MGFDIISICYALSVTGGGLMGYIKAGSTSSLIAGLAFGVVLSYGAYQTSIDESNYVLSLATTSVLGIVMGIRFFNSRKFMPAGLTALLSALMVMRYIYKNVLLPK